MNKKEAKKETNENLRKKFIVAVAMLLISTILMLTTTMAWLVLSRAPEVSGIATNIGANGALEIALLNTETYQNLNLIKTGTVGQSLSSNKTAPNNTWGNLIDLNDKSYGLGNIVLLPSRLNIVEKESEKGYSINSGMLSVPSYSYDGRIEKLTDNTTTATYNNSKFSSDLKQQNYGVRAIGTSDALTVQGSSLAMAKSQIPTFTKGAHNNAVSVLENDIKDLLTSLVLSYAQDNPTFSDSDVANLKEVIAGLQSSESYIEQALRQGLIAFAASKISDTTKFTAARNIIADSSKSLSEIFTQVKKDYKIEFVGDFDTWISMHLALEDSLDSANAACGNLTGGTYTKQQFTEVLNYVMDIEQVLINDTPLSKLSKDDASSLLGGKNNTMTLKQGSGAFAIIADFAENIVATISLAGTNFSVKTVSTLDKAYLVVLGEGVEKLTAADNSSSGGMVELSTTYGYAIDLAFRTNAPISNLLLQTAGVQRINEDSTSLATMGGGSYMEFDFEGKDLSNTLKLMDAVRVGFVDNKGDLLGLAKLNISNYEIDEYGMAKAPLYLYDFSISSDPETKGAIIMSERKKSQNSITPLQCNSPKVVTTVVWLDGDLVDNTMVSAEGTTLNGMLNLQFASDADLKPYINGGAMNYTTDKAGLIQAISDYESIYKEGQGTYTTVSWNNFIKAYNMAVLVKDSNTADDTRVYSAVNNLQSARTNLTKADKSVLKDKIDEIRELMGKTNDKVYVITLENGKYIKNKTEFTQEQLKNNVGVVYRVDYNKNLKNEGNGLNTKIYSDASWTALATALYDAEATFHDKKATETEIDAALLVLETAYNSLQPALYFMPCDLHGEIYYYAISDEKDSYGLWYDSSFKRILSETKILELDAYAEKNVEIADFSTERIPSNERVSSVNVELFDSIYSTLSNEKIVAAHWNIPKDMTFAMTATQKSELEALKEIDAAKNYKDAAQEMLRKYPDVSFESANTLISSMKAAVEAAKQPTDSGSTGNDLISANQKIVLAKAITLAQAVENFDNEENKELDALRTATTNARNALNNSATTYAEAESSISAINTELRKAGSVEATEENSVPYPLPEGSDINDILYQVDFPGFNFLIDDPTTKTVEFDAVLLTENGIIIKVKKNIEIYSPAADIKLTGEPKTELKVDETLALDWDFVNRKNNDGNEMVHSEKVATYEWSSSNTDVLTVSNEGVVTAESVGTATIWLRVETKQGNEYVVSKNITVG